MTEAGATVARQHLWSILGGLLLLLSAAPGMAQECPLGAAFCQGRYGASCYNPAYATCSNGLVCSGGASPCVGRYGIGCYNPTYAACYDGLVCATPLQPCLGPHGARCYDPSRATCSASPLRPHRRR